MRKTNSLKSKRAQYNEGGKEKKKTQRKKKKEEKWDKQEELKKPQIYHYDHCKSNELPNYKTNIVIKK